MPTYVYTCDACKHTFERFESMKAKPNTECIKCHKKKARRNISGGAGFLFKGGGFYTTDYRSSSYKDSAKKDSTSAPAAASPAPCGSCGSPEGPGSCKTETKSESKPKASSKK